VEENNDGVQDVVYTAGYYAAGFYVEVMKWFKYSEFKDRKWIDLDDEEQLKRLKMVESVVGSKTVDLLLHCRDYKIEHMWEIVGIVFERLTCYINSPQYENASELDWELEDLCFYCGEILRGIESVFKLVERDNFNEEEVIEWLTNAIGCVFKDEEDKEKEKLGECIADYLDGVELLETVIEQLSKVREVRNTKFSYDEEE